MKLKKIASLALAGVMAVSMLAGCSTTSNEVPQDPTTPPTTTPVSGKSAVFEAQLSDLADALICRLLWMLLLRMLAALPSLTSPMLFVPLRLAFMASVPLPTLTSVAMSMLLTSIMAQPWAGA